MARDRQVIKDAMTNSFVSNVTVQQLYGLTPGNTFAQEFSIVSLENILFDTISFAIHMVEKLWDVFKLDIEERIAGSRPFTKRWYRQTSLDYQHGYDLDEELNYPEAATAAEIELAEASKVIKRAEVVQTVISGVGALRLKVAGEENGTLTAIPNEQLLAFQEYIEIMGAAGVFVVATTAEADMLKLHYKIYFNPLVLDGQGRRLDGTDDFPVQNAIKEYLKSSNLNDFNGRLSLAKLTDVIQGVEGVEDPFVQSAASKYGNFTYESEGINVGTIENYRRADSGYFELDEEASTFEFLAAE